MARKKRSEGLSKHQPGIRDFFGAAKASDNANLGQYDDCMVERHGRDQAQQVQQQYGDDCSHDELPEAQAELDADFPDHDFCPTCMETTVKSFLVLPQE